MLLLRSSNLIQSSLHNVHFWLRYSFLCQVVSLQWFCPCHSEKYKVINPNIWCIPTQLLPHLQPSQACPQSSFDALLHQSCSTPFHHLSKLQYSLKVPFVLPWFSLGVVSQVFNEIKVRQFQTTQNKLFHDVITNFQLSQTCTWGHYFAKIYKMAYYPPLLEIFWISHEKQCKIVQNILCMMHFIPQENVHWFLSN